MITLATAEKALKTYYLDVIANSLNTQVNPLLAKFEQTEADVFGKEIRKTVFSGVNGGFGAGAEDGVLPTAGNQDYVQLTMTLKNLFGTLEISDKAVRAGNSNGAVVNLLEAEMQNLIDCARFNFGRMLYGNGTGIVAKATAVSGNTITVDDVKYLLEGMIVDVVGADDDTALVTARRVVSVDRTNKKITLGGATITENTVSSGDYITVQNSYLREIGGLGLIFGSGSTLYGVSRNTYSWLKPKTYTSTAVSGAVIQKAIDYVDDMTGMQSDFIVCSAGVKRAYINYLQTNSCNVEFSTLANGYKAINYGGIPLVSDRFCPDGTMYVLHTPDFKIYQLGDWDWIHDDGGRVLHQVPGKPVYSATICKYAELLCSRPAAQACISGITEA